MSHTSLILLLEDALILLGASPVSLVEDESPIPESPLLLLLSDLHALFASWSPPKEAHRSDSTSSPPPNTKPKVNHIAMKITFYAARAAATPSTSFAQLRGEIERKIAAMRKEAHGVGETRRTAPSMGSSLIFDSLRGIRKAGSGPSSARLVQEFE